MNLLAHSALAFQASRSWESGASIQAGLMAGAIIADLTKGTIPKNWPHALQSGVRLHRRIDAYSNTHPAIRQSSERFPPQYRRFAPIFIDVLADHYLSFEWHDHFSFSIAEVSQCCYAALAKYRGYWPPAHNDFFNYLRDHDLLGQYHQWYHVQRGLGSVLRRLNKSACFDEVNQASLAQLDAGQSDFRIYFPDMRHMLPAWESLGMQPAGREPLANQ